MIKYKLLIFLILVQTISCNGQKSDNTKKINITKNEIKVNCKEEEKLILEVNNVSFYTEDIIRGEGVISFYLKENESLTIYNNDNTFFGKISLKNNDSYDLNLPKKIVARRLIPYPDFESFSFDSEKESLDNEYLFIYINKEKKKLKKKDIKYNFESWEKYLNNMFISLKPCNILLNKESINYTYSVLEIKGDYIKISCSNDCSESACPKKQNMKGWLRWKQNNRLLINFSDCN